MKAELVQALAYLLLWNMEELPKSSQFFDQQITDFSFIQMMLEYKA